MKDMGRRRAASLDRVVRALVAAGLVAILSVGGVFAQDLGGQGPEGQARSRDAASHPEIKAASDKAIAASKKFVALTHDVYRTGNAPRQTDPAVAALLDAVFDVSILQKTKLGDDDGDAVAEWLLAELHVGAVYVGAGTGVANAFSLPQDIKAREKIDRNVATYAPEVGRYMDGEIVLETALLGTVLKGGPEPDNAMLRQANDKMRGGLATTVSGFLQTLVVPGVGYDWRLERLAALDAAAPKIAEFLDPARCGQLHHIVTLVSQKIRDSRVTDKLEAFDHKLTCRAG